MLFLMFWRHSCYLAIVICPTGLTLFRCRDLSLQLRLSYLALIFPLPTYLDKASLSLAVAPNSLFRFAL